MASLRRNIRKMILTLIAPFRAMSARRYKRDTEQLNHSVVHLFFHSLCIEPQLSFRNGNNDSTDFESWFITVTEFKQILERLYNRGYCLVDIHDAVLNHIALPEGKKPLVLSFDDVNYNNFMTGHGFASKMVLTSDGKIANSYLPPSGGEVTVYDGDCIPIIESFIDRHPDFSHKGARGVIALTGYEGILGYRNPEEEAGTLLPLISELKRRGWLFASHSWGHRHSAYSDGPVFNHKGKNDVRRWVREVMPFTGSTDIFITPFGIDTRNNPKIDLCIRQCGFKIICPVSDRNQIDVKGGVYYYSRISVDGVRFSRNPHALHPYIGNPYTLLSPFRKRIYPDAALTSKGFVEHARWYLALSIICMKGVAGKQMSSATNVTLTLNSEKLLTHYTMGGRFKFYYVKFMDLDCDELFAISEQSGPICSLPEIPGICLYMKGHAGIYEGNGSVIDCHEKQEHGYGVVRTNIADKAWTDWFKMPWVSYDKD